MGNTSRFSSAHGIVPLAVSGGLDYNAGGTLDSINMAKYNHCTLIILADASVAGNGILTIYGGTVDGSTGAAIPFTYRYSQGNAGAASADVLGSTATSSALTCIEASLVSRMLVVEFDAQDMYVSGTQYQYATPVLNADGTAGTCSAVAILSEPSYMKDIMPTAVPS